MGASRLGVWAIKHLVAPVHRRIYSWTNGRLFSRNILLLTTTGRRSGEARTTPVFFLRDGDVLVVCNVRPAAERANPWVNNLRAHPAVTVHLGARVMNCHARELRGNEIDRYWPRLVELWPAYAEHYQASGERAVFVLET